MNKRLLIIILSLWFLQCTCLQSSLHADILDSFTFPECCGSLAWDNGTMWCSTNTQMHNMDTSGNIIKSFDLPYEYTYGWPFAFDGQYFWVVENKYGRILQMDSQGNTLYSFKHSDSDEWATGLTWDGQYLWMVDADGHRIIRYDTEGNVITSIETPGYNEGDITFDGEYLWVGDYPNLYKIDFSGNYLFVLYYPEGSRQGLAHDGKYLWTDVCTDNESRIYRLDADRQTGTYEHFRWAFHTGADIDSSAAIGSDGTIYFGSWDKNFYAINPDGTVKWTFSLGTAILASPAIGPDGTIYIQATDDYYYALSPEGKEKWRFEVGGSVQTCLAIGKDGTVYATTYDTELYALNPDGTVKWKLKGPEFTGLAIGADETLYGVTSGGYVYAFTPEGYVKWRVRTWGRLDFPPAIAANGTIYVVADNRTLGGFLYAISPCGWVKWRFKLTRYAYCTPIIGDDGTIYADSGEILFAVNPNGLEKWSINVGGGISSTLALGKDGTIFAAVNIAFMNKKLIAISPNGTIQWGFNAGDTILSSPAIASDGTVYVGSSEGNLYAINTDCGGLAESAWPMYQQNPLHTGRAEEGPVPACSLCPAESLLGEDNKAVDDLRTFRDKILVKSTSGRKLIEMYYSNADRVTAFFDEHPRIKHYVGTALKHALSIINVMK